MPLAIALFFHPIGDHYTESDFYGAYAGGARDLLGGRVDPSRYGIYGPLYEFLLAALGAVGLDLFLAARLLSVAAAAVVLASAWAIVARALGRGAARWAIAFLGVTPVFLRYAYSATTDMVAAAFGTAGLAALLLGERRRALLAGGALIALATLTRYQAVVLLPAGLVLLALRRGNGAAWLSRTGAFAGAFAAVLAPWLLFSLAQGFLPGQQLIGNYRFYAAEDGRRNVQDHLVGASGTAPAAPASGEPMLATWARRAVEHFRHDVEVLLGAGFAIAAAAGGLLWWLRRGAPLRLAITLAGLFLYLGLVPAFYSDRYRLMLLPIYAAFVAAGWAAAAARGRVAKLAAAAALLAALAPVATKSFALQRKIHVELPRDVLALAPALDGAPPGAVVARKGHFPWHAHREVAAFPRVAGPGELAAAARASGARWLYYSWYEAQIRPEFLALLDTTRTLPGLERVAVSAFPPAVLYRIDPGFGDPGWFADDRQRALSEARASIWALNDSAAARGRAVLAADAFLRGDYAGAVALARVVRRAMPGDSLAVWVERYGEAKLKGLGERSTEVRTLAADPKFGWIAREARRKRARTRAAEEIQVSSTGEGTGEGGWTEGEDPFDPHP